MGAPAADPGAPRDVAAGRENPDEKQRECGGAGRAHPHPDGRRRRHRAVERPEDGIGALGSRRGVLRQQLHDECVERVWGLRSAHARMRRRFRHVRYDERLRAPAGEGMRAGEQFVGDHAKGVEVRASVGRDVARRLFGGHVRRGADRHSRRGQRRGARHGLRGRRGHRLGDPEVGHHGRALAEQHVLRFDVAVHDATTVRVRERPRDVAHHIHDVRDRERPVDDAIAQRRAAHEWHDVVRHTARGDAVAEYGNDVWLLQRRGELDLPRETLGTETLRQLPRQHLDHHLALQPEVTGEEHARHASPTQLTLERVRGAERELELRSKRVCHEGLGWGVQR